MAVTSSQSAAAALVVYALQSDVEALSTHFGIEVGLIHAMLNGEQSDLSALNTTAQDNLVNAINELVTRIDLVTGSNFATNAEAIAGTRADVGITPASLSAALDAQTFPAITDVDFRPTGNPDEYTVDVDWTNEDGTPQSNTDGSPVTIQSGVTTTDTDYATAFNNRLP